MGRRLQLLIPRVRDKWLRNMERRVIHIFTGLNTPVPGPPPPITATYLREGGVG